MYRTDPLLAAAAATPTATVGASLITGNSIEQWLRILALAVSIVASLHLIRRSRKAERNHDQQAAFYSRQAELFMIQQRRLMGAVPAPNRPAPEDAVASAAQPVAEQLVAQAVAPIVTIEPPQR